MYCVFLFNIPQSIKTAFYNTSMQHNCYTDRNRYRLGQAFFSFVFINAAALHRDLFIIQLYQETKVKTKKKKNMRLSNRKIQVTEAL